MYRRALAIQENALGENHPDVAKSLNNLAMLLEDQGKLAEAEAMSRRALAIAKTALGEDHPSVASSRGNLGVLLDAKARQLDEAGASDPAALARIYTEAADMQTFKYGAEDEDVLRCRQRAAELAGNYDEAETMCRSALAIKENTLGENHPEVAATRGKLGVLLDAKAQKLDGAGASDPAALARIYTEAADVLAPAYGENEDVLRCRRRAAELAGN